MTESYRPNPNRPEIQPDPVKIGVTGIGEIPGPEQTEYQSFFINPLKLDDEDKELVSFLSEITPPEVRTDIKQLASDVLRVVVAMKKDDKLKVYIHDSIDPIEVADDFFNPEYRTALRLQLAFEIGIVLPYVTEGIEARGIIDLLCGSKFLAAEIAQQLGFLNNEKGQIFQELQRGEVLKHKTLPFVAIAYPLDPTADPLIKAIEPYQLFIAHTSLPISLERKKITFSDVARLVPPIFERDIFGRIVEAARILNIISFVNIENQKKDKPSKIEGVVSNPTTFKEMFLRAFPPIIYEYTMIMDSD